MTAANYKNCYAFTEAYEGGRADNPADPGGRTMCGITQATYDAWRRRQGLPAKNVFESLASERAAIFREEFWDAIGGDSLPAGVDLAVYDFAVNSGPRTALDVLGHCGGPKIPARTLIRNICAYRLSILHGLRNWRRFGKGWGARVAACEATALRMCMADANTALKAARGDAAGKRETAGDAVVIAASAGGVFAVLSPTAESLTLVLAATILVIVSAVFKAWRHDQRVEAFDKELAK
jgi:lysozyme family protein